MTEENNTHKAWCSQHGCPPGECFTLHYPESEERKDNPTPVALQERAIGKHLAIQAKNREDEKRKKNSTGPSVNGTKEGS